MTPLIKFRACRDARRVTGDAMEVRGGCGYIEEFSDARLLRDAHLGSIWEGTSNIVALDVLRAVKREGALAPLGAHIAALTDDAEIATLRGRVFALVERALSKELLTRQAASALYHLVTAAAFLWEARRLDDPHRVSLARMVLRHRLLPRDPLADVDAEDAAFDLVAGTVSTALR
jgi:hypothetical protein